jgi:hypothetical protein
LGGTSLPSSSKNFVSYGKRKLVGKPFISLNRIAEIT